MSRILVVDNYPLIRRAMRFRLEADGHQVVGEASNGREALALLREKQPDLLIVDLAITQPGGLELIRRLKSLNDSIKVLVYSSGDVGFMAARTMQAGADGFVSKQADPYELATALIAVQQGRTHFPREALLELGESPGDDELSQLSPREFSVLQLLVAGRSNLAIAEALSINFKTVSTYKQRLMQKLHASSVVELADIARRHGLFAGESHEGHGVTATSRDDSLLQQILDVMPLCTHVCDVNGNLLFCNQAFCESAGLSLEEMRGRHITELGFTTEERMPNARAHISELIRRAEPFTLDVLITLRGKPRTIQHWGMPYRGHDGELIGMICGGVDVTEREAQIRELSGARLQADADNRAKTYFLDRVGSIFYAPLGALRSSLRQLRDELTLSERGVDVLERAERISQGLLRLSTDLGDLVSLERGRLSLEPKATNVRLLVESCVETFAEETRRRGLVLRCDTDGVLIPELWVDSQRILQVLGKLLGNALKNTPQGEVRVSLRSEPLRKGQAALILEVSDTGVGIAKEDLPILSAPFNLVPDQSGIARGDTGLGLALCHRLAQAMGGRLELQSELGIGTRALLYLEVPQAAEPN